MGQRSPRRWGSLRHQPPEVYSPLQATPRSPLAPYLLAALLGNLPLVTEQFRCHFSVAAPSLLLRGPARGKTGAPLRTAHSCCLSPGVLVTARSPLYFPRELSEDLFPFLPQPQSLGWEWPCPRPPPLPQPRGLGQMSSPRSHAGVDRGVESDSSEHVLPSQCAHVLRPYSEFSVHNGAGGLRSLNRALPCPATAPLTAPSGRYSRKGQGELPGTPLGGPPHPPTPGSAASTCPPKSSRPPTSVLGNRGAAGPGGQ